MGHHGHNRDGREGRVGLWTTFVGEGGHFVLRVKKIRNPAPPAYIAIAEQGIQRSHFGFPNFFVPFIAATTACMNSMGQRSLATSNSGRLANQSNEDRYGTKRSR
jgi:hypothetical protein